MVNEGSDAVTLLRIQDLFAGYRKKTVLHDVNLQLKEAELAALIGHNGAGKTTLLTVIHGILRSSRGSILLDGVDITNTAKGKRISLVPQGKGVFSNLTVLENLKLAYHTSEADVIDESSDRLHGVYELFPRLRERKGQKAGLMSGGEQRMLSVAMGLMQRPRLLLLDEPSLGLAPVLVQNLMESLLQINQSYKTSMLLVEQNVRKALEVSQRTYIMKMGRIIHEDMSSSILSKGNYWDYF